MKAWLPARVPFGLRVFFRGVFLLLALATVALALGVLQEEKQLAQRSQRQVFEKNHAQITALLRHPTGQLALLNAAVADRPVTPLRPLVLPYSAIDFDDRDKAQQAIEMAGCLVRYPDAASMCVAVGHNPFAGGFVYVAGSFASGDLVAHTPGGLDFGAAHRVRISLAWRGSTWRWIAPLQQVVSGANSVRGRLTGFDGDAAITPDSRPLREFRGWLWQDGRCADASPLPQAADCPKRSFVALRLPVQPLREALFERPRPVWPPADLDRMSVHVEVLAPGDGKPLFDSDSPGAVPPFSWADLAGLLLPGETLEIRKAGAAPGTAALVRLAGTEVAPQAIAPWLDQLIGKLPVERPGAPLTARDRVSTPLGDYELLLRGDARAAHQGLAAVTSRVAWFVGAMLVAIALAWLAIELRIIRRITLLTRRAAAVAAGMRSGDAAPATIDLAELRGRDELGVLASGLQALLDRVNDDLKRERIRVAQERDTWHAVGHEIMSPLQSLLALHAASDDPSRRYIGRMQQAVHVLYGKASPSEAFTASALRLDTLDLDRFLGHVAANAAHAGIADVHFEGPGMAVPVQADDHSLEDAVTHVLRNADRCRVAGTPITITLAADAMEARTRIHNQGPPIAPALMASIFEYGVSDAPDGTAQRGQGLFVARTYMAKMGGTITARNVEGGVCFDLVLPVDKTNASTIARTTASTIRG